MIYEVPFVGGPRDGQIERFPELRPQWEVALPSFDFNLAEHLGFERVDPIGVRTHFITVLYQLQWFLLPMLDVEWYYPVYVHGVSLEMLIRSRLWVGRGNTYVERKLCRTEAMKLIPRFASRSAIRR